MAITLDELLKLHSDMHDSYHDDKISFPEKQRYLAKFVKAKVEFKKEHDL